MLQKFFLKAMLKKQLKGVPEDQQEMILSAVEKNPDLFIKIAEEVKGKMEGGAGQQDAMMAVMQKYQNELRSAMGK